MEITKQMIKKYVVIHCDTDKKSIELLRKLDDLGYEWNSDDSYLSHNNYHRYKEDTCYNPYEGTYSNVSYCKKQGYKIIEYELDDEVDYQENTNIKKQLDKANDRIYELGRCIKHLQGSNRNKQNRIKNLESKLEEYKSIDDVMNLDLDEFLCYFQKLAKDVNNGVEEMLLGDNTIIIVAWLERFKKMLNQF